jgi:hypothetical protein
MRRSARANEARLEACKKWLKERYYGSHDACDLYKLPAYNDTPNGVKQIRVRRESLYVDDLYDRSHDNAVHSFSSNSNTT